MTRFASGVDHPASLEADLASGDAAQPDLRPLGAPDRPVPVPDRDWSTLERRSRRNDAAQEKQGEHLFAPNAVAIAVEMPAISRITGTYRRRACGTSSRAVAKRGSADRAQPLRTRGADTRPARSRRRAVTMISAVLPVMMTAVAVKSARVRANAAREQGYGRGNPFHAGSSGRTNHR